MAPTARPGSHPFLCSTTREAHASRGQFILDPGSRRAELSALRSDPADPLVPLHPFSPVVCEVGALRSGESGSYDHESFGRSKGSLHARRKIEVRHGKPACLDRLTVQARRVVPTGGVE